MAVRSGRAHSAPWGEACQTRYKAYAAAFPDQWRDVKVVIRPPLSGSLSPGDTPGPDRVTPVTAWSAVSTLNFGVRLRLGVHQRNPQDVITCNYMHYMDITCHYMLALYMILHVIKVHYMQLHACNDHVKEFYYMSLHNCNCVLHAVTHM
jgi:hypothetical protein